MHPLLRAAWACLATAILFPGAVAAQNFDWHRSTGIDGNVFAIAFDASGGQWVARGGLAHFDGTAWANYDTINSNGGLVDDGVMAVLVDRGGNVWAGTEAGVSKFDGRQWTRYTTASTGGGLSAGEVSGIAQDRKGNLWFSIRRKGDKQGGVSRFDGSTWAHWGETGKPLPCSTFGAYGVAVDSKDTPWVAMGDCVAAFDGARWTTYDQASTGGALQGAFSIAADRQGGVWFGGVAAVTRHADGRWTRSGPYGIDTRRAPATPGDDQDAGLIRSGGDPRHAIFDGPMTVDGDGNLWAAATVTDNPASLPGLFRYDGNGWKRYEPNEAWRHITAVATDLRGKVWVSAGALYQFDGSIQATRDGARTLAGPPNGVAALGLDGEGNVWAGGYGEASVFDGRQWMPRAAAWRGLPPDMTVTHIASRDPGTWVALANDSDKAYAIARRTGSAAWTVFRQADMGVQLGEVSDLAIDSRGTLWAATDGGLLKYDGTRWTLLTRQTTSGGLPSNSVRAVVTDARDQVWIGSAPPSVLSPASEGGGVSRFDGSTWTTWTTANTGGALATSNITFLRFDSKGRLWAGVGASLALRNRGGLGLFDGTHWRTLTAADNKPLDATLHAIAPDRQGGIWLATEGGAARYDGEGHWQTLTRASTMNAFPADDVKDIVVDRTGNVWFAFNRDGLAVLKAAGTSSASTARPLPLRVAASEPRFPDLPEAVAYTQWLADRAAKVKADAAKAKSDAAAALATMSPADLQDKFCEAFDAARNTSALNRLMADYASTSLPIDTLMQSPGCKMGGIDLPARGPVMHFVPEDNENKASVLTAVWRYYKEKRNDEGLWLKAVNAKNTRGETMLDYVDSLIDDKLLDRPAVASLVKFACSKGAVYAKPGKSCP